MSLKAKLHGWGEVLPRNDLEAEEAHLGELVAGYRLHAKERAAAVALSASTGARDVRAVVAEVARCVAWELLPHVDGLDEADLARRLYRGIDRELRALASDTEQRRPHAFRPTTEHAGELTTDPDVARLEEQSEVARLYRLADGEEARVLDAIHASTAASVSAAARAHGINPNTARARVVSLRRKLEP